MAPSNPKTIEIIESNSIYRGDTLCMKELYIDRARRAAIVKQLNGQIKFVFEPVGKFDLQEAQVWIQGLLELSMHIEEMIDD